MSITALIVRSDMYCSCWYGKNLYTAFACPVRSVVVVGHS